jgi:hypothetical protein
MKDTFQSYVAELIEQHLPVPFIDYDHLTEIKKGVCFKTPAGRKEALILAYVIGANAEEGNKLLCLLGHPPLYVKRREDAIWKFALNNRWDSKSIIDEIFLQNVDEKIT